MDFRERVKFIQVLGIDGLAVVHKYRFTIVERTLIQDVFTRLDSCSKPCFKTVPLRGVDAAWACVGLLVFGSHLLLVSAYRGVPAEKAEEAGHATDRGALEASNWHLGGVGG